MSKLDFAPGAARSQQVVHSSGNGHVQRARAAMARRPRPDGAALQRVVAHVQTHNRVLQEDEMWERHRAAAAGAPSQPAGQRTTNTPESIAVARREAELRRMAVKEAAASAAGRAELQSTATDLQPEPAEAARERAERKAERRAKKAERKAKKAERRAIKKERKERKRRRKRAASDSDSSSSNS